MRIGDQEATRLRVLKAIRRTEPVSRTALVAMTGLSSSCITNITAELVERNFVLEARQPGVARGRPRVQLMLNPAAARVVGAFMMPDGALSVEITNTRGDSLFKMVAPLKRCSTMDEIAEQIAAAVDRAITQGGFDRTSIQSLGLALPAMVDSAAGVLHWMPTFTNRPVPIAAILEARLKLPVTVDNDANVIARAEHWFGPDRGAEDFSLFVAGLAIGFARYQDGVLQTGVNGMNFEIQHVKIGLDQGPRCICGARGCLAVSATLYGALLHVYEARNLPLPDLREVANLFGELGAQAIAGDPVVREAFDRTGRVLGAAVANHVNMNDPALVLVRITDPTFADLIVAPFYAALQENALPGLRSRTRVQFAVADDRRYAEGAAAMVLERLYRTPRPQMALAPS